jgi:hydroxymethylpyrimidine/phosphomethylpyrimidine kinase
VTAVALTIVGSDPSGGASIQADLKTFSALGVYGTAVLTALTAQNTRGVTGVHPVPAEFVGAQLRTLLNDVPVQATKLGMLDTTPATSVAELTEQALALLRLGPRAVLAKGGHLGGALSVTSWPPQTATG